MLYFEKRRRWTWPQVEQEKIRSQVELRGKRFILLQQRSKKTMFNNLQMFL